MDHHIHRHPERAVTERARLDALLDELCVATLSTVSPEGEPWAIPINYARVGDSIVMHGSTGAGALRRAASGAPIVLTMAAVDALVVGATAFSHSVNYRSASVRGIAARVSGDEQITLVGKLTDGFLPGRMTEVPALTRKQLAATMVLSLAITDDNWIVKARDTSADDMVLDVDGAGDEGWDGRQPWGGIVPLRTVTGEPQPAPWAQGPVPPSVRAIRRD